VVATTLTVIAVFGPIAFLQGVVGQFFKEFGLTVCFTMAISLFDALTVAPMLSAYYAGTIHRNAPRNLAGRIINSLLESFNHFQNRLENFYVQVLHYTLKKPLRVLATSFVIFIVSLVAAKFVPKTFIPAQDNGEFGVNLDLPPGTNLAAMQELADKVDKVLRANPEIKSTVLTTGSADGQSNKATFFVELVSSKLRSVNTSQMKDKLREQLIPFAKANPKVTDIDFVGGGQRPFTLSILGPDLDQLIKVSSTVFEKLKNNPALKDVDITYRPGKPEFQIQVDLPKAEKLGVSTNTVGNELRTLVDGMVPAVFRQNGQEYDIRVRLKEDQRDLVGAFTQTYVPNINNSIVRLDRIANPVVTTGLANIDRQDRGRVISITADMAANGPGLGGVMTEIDRLFKEDIKLPEGMRYAFEGQAENFKELMINMVVAAGLGVLFIYLVLASLYESFVIPFTIMMVLPLAACGAFYALFITGASLNLFSMIGCIMLLGIATKNSILLVDYTNQMLAKGMDRNAALLEAGKNRLRPILMTSFALIAGMLPLAAGLSEAAKQRTSLGIAVIGGIISSTILTLVVVPAVFSYIDRFRIWSSALLKKLFGAADSSSHDSKEHSEIGDRVEAK
jgi:HAE1 family hydrophobic/amphiphilic exporter-1